MGFAAHTNLHAFADANALCYADRADDHGCAEPDAAPDEYDDAFANAHFDVNSGTGVSHPYDKCCPIALRAVCDEIDT